MTANHRRKTFQVDGKGQFRRKSALNHYKTIWLSYPNNDILLVKISQLIIGAMERRPLFSVVTKELYSQDVTK